MYILCNKHRYNRIHILNSIFVDPLALFLYFYFNQIFSNFLQFSIIFLFIFPYRLVNS